LVRALVTDSLRRRQDPWRSHTQVRAHLAASGRAQSAHDGGEPGPAGGL